MASIKQVKKLKRGDMVRANGRIDGMGANVYGGDYGVVFEEAEYHEPNSGPMVRWYSGGACNVYDGDVTKVSR